MDQHYTANERKDRHDASHARYIRCTLYTFLCGRPQRLRDRAMIAALPGCAVRRSDAAALTNGRCFGRIHAGGGGRRTAREHARADGLGPAISVGLIGAPGGLWARRGGCPLARLLHPAGNCAPPTLCARRSSEVGPVRRPASNL